MLINEDKRPNLITNQEEPPTSLTGEVKGGTGGGPSQDHQTWSDPTTHQKTPSSSEEGQSGSSNNDEFQLTCFAKGGIGLSLVTRDPPEEILYMFMSNVVIDYQVYSIVPGFRVLGFSALPGFRALKAGDRAWSGHKTLFGFRAPLSQLFI